MKIKKITLKNFKRFSDLTISEIPESAKLVVLVGPNGSGKTSLFEAFNHWYRLHSYGNVGKQDYFEKKEGVVSSGAWYQNKVDIELFNNPDATQLKGKFYFRTPYRNEADYSGSGIFRCNADPENSSLGTTPN